MQFVIYIEIKCMTITAQRSGQKKCKYTTVTFLYCMWSSIMSFEDTV